MFREHLFDGRTDQTDVQTHVKTKPSECRYDNFWPTVVQIGATGSLDTTTTQSPVIAFNFGESGLMAGVSVEGTKVTKLDR